MDRYLDYLHVFVIIIIITMLGEIWIGEEDEAGPLRPLEDDSKWFGGRYCLMLGYGDAYAIPESKDI